MKLRRSIFLVIALLLISNRPVKAQTSQTAAPSNVQMILSLLEGDFRWEMLRPSDNTALRTGVKSSRYELDSLVLVSHEEFDSASIQQLGIFGYNESTNDFFTVGFYNIDVGPHISKGHLIAEDKIEFSENDSSKFYLNIADSMKYFWTYKSLKDGVWESGDLKIVFSRIIAEGKKE